jgi:hypothetical protein
VRGFLIYKYQIQTLRYLYIMSYIYKHIRPDTNEVFYIGVGVDERRINSNQSRNKFWKNIVNKHGIIREIIEDNLSWDDAIKREQYWIKFYGRKNNNTGRLCNMTDGGEGSYGRILSNETKQKISESNKGKKMTNEQKIKISEGNKGKPKPKPKDFSEKMRNITTGKVRTEESKIKQSITTKKTLSKIKDRLKEKSKGIKNSNAVRYFLFDVINSKEIEIDGYKTVLDYYNIISHQSKKDAMFLIKKIKENQIEELKFIKSIKINSK